VQGRGAIAAGPPLSLLSAEREEGGGGGGLELERICEEGEENDMNPITNSIANQKGRKKERKVIRARGEGEGEREIQA